VKATDAPPTDPSPDAEGLLRLAVSAHESGDMVAAEAAYRDAAEAGNVVAAFQLGAVLQSRGAYELAATAYAPAAASGDIEAVLNLAILLAYELGRPDDAIELFRELALRGDARGWLELGMLYAHQGGFAEAESVLRKALDDEPRAHMALGSVLSAMDRHEDALISYRAALTQEIDGAWSGVAWELMRLDRLEAAEDAATRGVAAQDPGAGGVLGVVLRQRGASMRRWPRSRRRWSAASPLGSRTVTSSQTWRDERTQRRRRTRKRSSTVRPMQAPPS
jgi:uncharacterized protein